MAEVLRVTLHRDGRTGQGECVPYARYGETLDSVEAQLRAVPSDLRHADLPTILPAGAARNALDCAFWDLAAKLGGCRVWDLLQMPQPQPTQTAYTLSLQSAGDMEAAARAQAHRPILKIKLGTADDIPRLEAVRRGAPKSQIIVDANEGWTADQYRAYAPALVGLGVALVEQPLPVGQDQALAGLARPVPICADESCHTRADLPGLHGLYDAVNVKLDKAGGLTEALALKTEALARGFDIMVGCMVGSSLGMAPATLLTEGAIFTDLDGPLLLAEDRAPALVYDADGVHSPQPQLWG